MALSEDVGAAGALVAADVVACALTTSLQKGQFSGLSYPEVRDGTHVVPEADSEEPDEAEAIEDEADELLEVPRQEVSLPAVTVTWKTESETLRAAV